MVNGVRFTTHAFCCFNNRRAFPGEPRHQGLAVLVEYIHILHDVMLLSIK